MTPPSSLTPGLAGFTDLTRPDLPAGAVSIASSAKFPLGRLHATPGALAALAEFSVSPLSLLIRHSSGDWGELDDHDRQVNELAVAHGDRILSAYLLTRVEQGRTIEVRLWIITEADRAATVILLPSEY